MDGATLPNCNFLTETLAGLGTAPKSMSPKWFYDEQGSHLFEQITQLPEYYPTRTETAILRDQIDRAGLAFVRSVEFGKSYDITLRRWHDTFNDRWESVAEHGFDDRFRRMWNFYLTSCAATFDSGNCDVTQITMSRPT